MTKDMGKAKVISDFFALAFTDKTEIFRNPGPLRTKGKYEVRKTHLPCRRIRNI